MKRKLIKRVRMDGMSLSTILQMELSDGWDFLLVHDGEVYFVRTDINRVQPLEEQDNERIPKYI